MSVRHLKIKIKSLAQESRYIKQEEKKLKAYSAYLRRSTGVIDSSREVLSEAKGLYQHAIFKEWLGMKEIWTLAA